MSGVRSKGKMEETAQTKTRVSLEGCCCTIFYGQVLIRVVKYLVQLMTAIFAGEYSYSSFDESEEEENLRKVTGPLRKRLEN